MTSYFMLRLAISIIMMAAILMAISARAQHNHGQMGLAGEFYSTWLKPKIGPRTESCCNMRDCYQALVRGGHGHWEYRSRMLGSWRPLPEN